MVKPTFNKSARIQHWVTMADSDYDTMMDLYKSKRDNWTLFLGHLVIEKLLKAC